MSTITWDRINNDVENIINGIKTTNIVYIILEVLLLLFRKLPLLTLNSFIYDSPSL